MRLSRPAAPEQNSAAKNIGMEGLMTHARELNGPSGRCPSDTEGYGQPSVERVFGFLS